MRIHCLDPDKPPPLPACGAYLLAPLPAPRAGAGTKTGRRVVLVSFARPATRSAAPTPMAAKPGAVRDARTPERFTRLKGITSVVETTPRDENTTLPIAGEP